MLESLREEVFEANLELVRRNLVIYTFGNASGVSRGEGLAVIKPSGVPYETMTPKDLVVTDLDGRVVEGALRPSSDLPTHLALYRAFPALGGVVHTHSMHATAWAQARREIPCLGTTHADDFRGPVPITEELPPAAIDADYELNIGHAIVRRFAALDPLEIPACWWRVTGRSPGASRPPRQPRPPWSSRCSPAWRSRLSLSIPRHGRCPTSSATSISFANTAREPIMDRNDMTRRGFVQASALAPAAAYLAAAAADGDVFDRPMRWAQLTLVEDDPGKYDPKFWLDYFQRIHADAACLSAGGCVAYYPTKVPFHHRSAWLGNSDPFGELYEGCRKLGMVVLARTDPHATYQDVYEAHPDWIAVDAQGRKRRHWASPEMWVTCALGPYNFEFMTEVTREIASMYKVDGIFSNRWSGSGMCYCEHCRKNFRAYSGMDLPATSNSAGSGAPEIPGLAAGTPVRAVALVGRGGPQGQPRDALHRQRRWWSLERSGHEDHRRTGAHAVRRPPGAAGPGRLVVGRDERQGVPCDAGAEGDRRHLQRGSRGDLPLERFGPERPRDPPVGVGRGSQRAAAVVYEILRDAA